MRSELLLALAGLSLAVAGCAASTEPAISGSAPAAAAQQDGRTDPATLVATGKPRRCIPNRNNVNTTPAGDSVLMFRTGANTWYRNDLRSRCPGLSRNAVLVFRSSSSQHCEMDIFEIVDPVSRMTFGSCSLGAFTPVKVPRGANF